jgi:hypothetical protein
MIPSLMSRVIADFAVLVAQARKASSGIQAGHIPKWCDSLDLLAGIAWNELSIAILARFC